MSGSPQDMFLQAMGAMFSSSLPAPAVLAAANAFIFDFSQHRDCFFTCMLILNEPVTDIAIRAFCANILYNKIRKQLHQLSPDETQQLLEALHQLLSAPHTLHLLDLQYDLEQSQQLGLKTSEMRTFLRLLLRCQAALGVRDPGRLSVTLQLAQQWLSSSSSSIAEVSGAQIAGLQLLAALQEEAEDCYVSRRQRRPLLRQLRQCYRLTACQLLPAFLSPLLSSETLQPSMVHTSLQAILSQVALCRAAAELCRALAETDGRLTRDLGLSHNSVCAMFLLQFATNDQCPLHSLRSFFAASASLSSTVLTIVKEDLTQTSVQTHAALRILLTRAFLLSSPSSLSNFTFTPDTGDIEVQEEAVDYISERHTATQLLDMFLPHLLNTATSFTHSSDHTQNNNNNSNSNRSEVCRRECVATLMAVSLACGALDTLLPPSHSHNGSNNINNNNSNLIHLEAERAKLLLQALVTQVSRPPRSVLLITVDFWLELDNLLFRDHKRRKPRVNDYNTDGNYGDNDDNEDGMNDNSDENSDDNSDSDDDGSNINHNRQKAAFSSDFGLINSHIAISNQLQERRHIGVQWVVTQLLPHLLQTCVSLCRLPIYHDYNHKNKSTSKGLSTDSEDEVEDEEVWEDVATLRDTRQGLDDLLSLCVAGMGLRHSLPLLCQSVTLSSNNSVTANSMVSLECVSFLLGSCDALSLRWTVSRDTEVVLPLLHSVATQCLANATQALSTIQQTMGTNSSNNTINSSTAKLALSETEDRHSLLAALYLRSTIKYLSTFALLQHQCNSDSSIVQTVSQLCVSLSLCGGVATHPCVLHLFNNNNSNTQNNNGGEAALSLQEWSDDTATQCTICVSQAAETLRRLLLTLRNRILNSSDNSSNSNNNNDHATQLAQVATQTLAGVLQLLTLSSSSLDNSQSSVIVIPVYMVSLTENALATLFTSLGQLATHCDTPEELCHIVSVSATHCDTLLRRVLLSVTQILGKMTQILGDARHSVVLLEMCRSVSQLLSIANVVLESLAQDTSTWTDSLQAGQQMNDVQLTGCLTALLPAFLLLFTSNSNNTSMSNGILSEVSVATQQALSLAPHLFTSPALSEAAETFQLKTWTLLGSLLQLLCWIHDTTSHLLTSSSSTVLHLPRTDTLLSFLHSQLPLQIQQQLQLEAPIANTNTVNQHLLLLAALRHRVVYDTRRQVCISLCRSFAACLNIDNSINSIKNTSISSRGLTARAMLSMLQQHFTSLCNVLFHHDNTNTSHNNSIDNSSSDEYSGTGNSEHSSLSLWAKQTQLIFVDCVTLCDTYVFAYNSSINDNSSSNNSNNGAAYGDRRTEVLEENMCVLATQVLLFATQLLTLPDTIPVTHLQHTDNTGPTTGTMSWRAVLLHYPVSNNTFHANTNVNTTVMKLVVQVCLSQVLPQLCHRHTLLNHHTSTNTHDSSNYSANTNNSGNSGFQHSHIYARFLRDAWRCVATLLQPPSSTLTSAPSLQWLQEVVTDTLQLPTTGVQLIGAALQTLHLCQHSSATVTTTSRSNNNTNTNYSGRGSAVASHSQTISAAEMALLLLLAALHCCTTATNINTNNHTNTIATNSQVSDIAVTMVAAALAQSLPALQQQLQQLHYNSTNNRTNNSTNNTSNSGNTVVLTNEHIALALLQQVAMACASPAHSATNLNNAGFSSVKYPPADNRLRRARQLLRDLQQVCVGMQQVETLADYLLL